MDKLNETLLSERIEKGVNERIEDLFLTLQKENGIEDGHIYPRIALELMFAEDNLCKVIEKAIRTQIEQRKDKIC